MAARNRGGRPRKTASSRAANSARPPPSRGNFRTFCFRARMPWRPARCTHTRPRAASSAPPRRGASERLRSARPLRRVAPRSMHALRPRHATILEEVAEILWGCVSLSSKRWSISLLDLRGSERIFVIVISTDLYFVRGKRAMISFFFFGCFLGVGRCLRVGRVGWWRLAKWGKIGRLRKFTEEK